MTQDKKTPRIPLHLSRWLEGRPRYLCEPARPAVTPDNARNALEEYKLAMRRYDPRQSKLPWKMQSECPTCDQTVPSEFYRVGEKLMLSIRCPTCGEVVEEHLDAIWTEPIPSHSPDSPSCTYSGSRINPNLRGLPRTVETLCPECSAVIAGRYYAKNGRVMIEKTCPEHGYYRDCVNSDVRLYLRCAHWTFEEFPGLTNPRVVQANRCPTDCGLCNQHQSTSALGQVEMTNRCNLTCPVCFANANASGFVREPSFEDIEREMKRLIDCRPIPCNSIQFTGGESTLYPRWFDVLRRARELGFTNIQVATNGIKFAEPEFAMKSREAGLHSLYLQFDGLDDDLYRRVRGKPLLEIKNRAVENCRRAGLKICLVPTIIKGENDEQVAKIFDYAVENIDVISAIAYQPVCFTGRISRRELESKRYTLGDLAHDICRHTGAAPERDILPLSFMAPLSNILSAVEKKPKITCSCHSDCAVGTYFVVGPREYPGQPTRERVVPIPQVFDMPTIFTRLNELAKRIAPKKKWTWWDIVRIYWITRRNFRGREAPKWLTATKFIRAVRGCVSKEYGRTEMAQKEHIRTLMCAGMHFQDRYNYDCERVKRCVIHYSTPDGIYPFCTYNSGPTFRTYIEALWGREVDRQERAPTTSAVALVGADQQ